MPGLRDALVYFPFAVSSAVIGTSEDFDAGPFGTFSVLDENTAVLWSIGYLALALGIAVLAIRRAQITQ